MQADGWTQIVKVTTNSNSVAVKLPTLMLVLVCLGVVYWIWITDNPHSPSPSTTSTTTLDWVLLILNTATTKMLVIPTLSVISMMVNVMLVMVIVLVSLVLVLRLGKVWLWWSTGRLPQSAGWSMASNNTSTTYHSWGTQPSNGSLSLGWAIMTVWLSLAVNNDCLCCYLFYSICCIIICVINIYEIV